MIQKYQTAIIGLLVIVALFILGLFGLLITKEVKSIIALKDEENIYLRGELAKTDTVIYYKEYHYTETLKLQPIKMDGTVTPEFLIQNNIPVDTNKFKFNELPLHTYIDTIRKDSSYVVITDQTAGWRTNAKVDFYLKYPITTVTNTIVKQRFRMYTYMRFGSQMPYNRLSIDIAPGVGFVSKRGVVASYDYNFTRKIHGITIGYVINLKKK